MIKTNPCKFVLENGQRCGSPYHTAMWHKPRKPIAVNKPLKRSTKPIRFEAEKTREKRKATEAAWFEANPPDKDGFWYCYISRHPLCPKRLDRSTVVLEHDISKARNKSLQFVVSNIHPACAFDNKAKGSLSAKEYMAL